MVRPVPPWRAVDKVVAAPCDSKCGIDKVKSPGESKGTREFSRWLSSVRREDDGEAPRLERGAFARVVKEASRHGVLPEAWVST